jgi:hypothetical protein
VEDNKELLSTIKDLKILSNLAMYQSFRIPAAVSYRIFEHTKHPQALDDAILYEQKAINSWEKIVEAAGDIYAHDLMMGSRKTVKYNIIHRLSGHWKDEIVFMKEGLDDLKSLRDSVINNNTGKLSARYESAETFSNEKLFNIEHVPLTEAKVNQDIQIKLKVEPRENIEWIKLRFRSVNQTLSYKTLKLNNNNSGVYNFTVLADQIDAEFDFMYFFEIMNKDGYGYIYPDFDVETPYYFVKLQRQFVTEEISTKYNESILN